MCVGTVQMDNDEPPVNIYRGMRVVFSQNRDKKNGVVNGQPAIVIMMQGFTVVLQLRHSKKVSVYPVTTTNQSQCDNTSTTQQHRCYPFVPAYAMTICKSQGQTLNDIIVWFDTACLGPGAAHVALSRVKALNTLKFLTPLQMSHFEPVTFSSRLNEMQRIPCYNCV